LTQFSRFSVAKLALLCLFVILSKKTNAQNCASQSTPLSIAKSNSATYRGETIKIPVVVHIVYNESVENISEEQIRSQIDVLNQDFRQKNDQSTLPNEFKTVAADVNIEFYLANIDPKGKASKGFTRTYTASTNVWQDKALSNGLQKRKLYFTDIEGRDAWDTKKYLNIWVCKMPSGRAGYATFPNQVKPDEADGIVIDYRFFGTKGEAVQNFPFHLGRTCTHEIGHFLNLQHLWGGSISNDNCNADDEVSDTPKQTGPVTGCPTSPVFQCGKSVMFQNFMNYSNDACMALFTEGQKNRMLDALTQFRPMLLNNMIAEKNTQNIDIQYFPNPVNAFLSVVLPKEAICFLSNAQGQKVLETQLNEGYNILDTNNFPNGMYQLGIVIDNNLIIKKINVLH
jgi:Pregnancy-associated plasma protein-A